MKREAFKVSEEEYKAVLAMRKDNIGVDEVKEIARLRSIKKEERQRNRLKSIENNNRHIRHMERARKFKEEEVKTGVSVETHQGYKEGKPIFMIENEIEEINAQITEILEMNKAAKEEYDREEKNAMR